MIKGKDLYEVVASLVPLYVALFLGYGSVRWWKIFTPEQCPGISRFVAVFAMPFLIFHFLSSNNPYTMNVRFLAADSLQKLLILVALFLWNTLTKRGSINSLITLFSLSTLPNTIVIGVPLLKAMYGDFTANLMVQIVFLQGVIWNNVLLFMFEYRAAMLLISEQLPESAARAISSFRVDSNVSSLNCIREPLHADAEIGENGEVHVVVRSMSRPLFHKSYSTPIASNLTREPSERAPISFNGINFYPTSLRCSSFKEEIMLKMHEKRCWRSKSCGEGSFNSGLVSSRSSLKSVFPAPGSDNGAQNATTNNNKFFSAMHEIEIEEGIGRQKEVSIEEGNANKKQQMPCGGVMIMSILVMVWRRLIRNPNAYASVLGLVWSLIAFRCSIKMPSIVEGSISILSNTALGMSMFSLGIFMASQPKLISCGKTWAAISMAIKFLVGPAVMAATSKALSLHGVFFQVAIVQAALPQGLIPFVFAKEYNLHADILSTSVIFGTVVALPITIIYYVFLGLL